MDLMCQGLPREIVEVFQFKELENLILLTMLEDISLKTSEIFEI